jgi:hypothetical protein
MRLRWEPVLCGLATNSYGFSYLIWPNSDPESCRFRAYRLSGKIQALDFEMAIKLVSERTSHA